MRNNNIERNYSIEAFRFIFICILCFHHCRPLMPILGSAYLVVEFFFILSGFFLYRSFKKHHETGTIDYTLKRIKLFCVPTIITLSLLMALDRKHYIYLSEFTPDGILTTYFSHLQEFFFCQSIGIAIGGINHPLWYLSVLIVGGGILYSLLRNYREKAVSLYLPILCLISFSYVLENGNHRFENWNSVLGFPITMARGMADMSLGIITAYFIEKKSAMLNNRYIFFNVLGCISLIGFVLMLFSQVNLDYLSLFFVPLIITTCFICNNIFSKVFYSRTWKLLGGASLYMYIIHLLIANIYYIIARNLIIINTPTYILSALYILIIIIVAFTLKHISEKINKKLFI